MHELRPEFVIATIALASIFLMGKWLRLPKDGVWRDWISASAGASVAYVWIHMIPELNQQQQAFNQAAGTHLPAPQLRVYVCGLIGFLGFYGFQHMRRRAIATAGADELGQPAHPRSYRLYLVGFSFYVALVGYLMIESSERGLLSLIIYWVAMALHFLAVNHSFEESGEQYYDQRGRWLLASAVLVGGFTGMFTTLNVRLLATLLGLLSGGVIVNSVLMELPRGREGKFIPFFSGAALFSVLLASI